MTISIADSTALDTGLTDIADAIRAKGGTKDKLQFPDEFVDAVENIDPTRWSKPADWPDLDALELPTDHSENVIYLLYDRKCGIDAVSMSFSGADGATIERGTVIDGEFVGEQVASMVTSFTDTLEEEYTVYRTSGKFTWFGFNAYAVLDGYTMTYQGVVWVRGAAPMLTVLGGSRVWQAMLGVHTQAYELYDTLALQYLTLPERAFYTMPASRYRVGVGSDGDYNGNTIKRTGNGPMFYHGESNSVLTIKNAVFEPNSSSCKYVTRVRFENVTFPNGLAQKSFTDAVLKSIEFADTCDVECSDMYQQFSGCYYLETCDMHIVDFTNATRSISAFQYCYSLKDLRLNATWKMDLNLSACIYMPKSTVIQLFNDLGTIDTTHTITLPYGMKNYLLTPEEIAVVTEKGWTVA